VAYRFEADESVRNAMLRCAGEQLDRAVSELSERISSDPVEAVHAARKAVKKERSLLRMARGSMPAKQRRRENAALREAAQGLSGARDAEAMIATLDDLSERYAGQVPESTFHEIRQQLETRRDQQRGELVGSALGAQAVGELGAVRVRVEDWTLEQRGWKAIETGLRRSYTDGRKAFARAQSRRSAEKLHTWRKRVKDLWYQERLLASVAGPVMAGQVKEAHRLADLLGDDHDLAVLRQALTPGKVQAPVDLDAVVGLIDHRRDTLQTEAFYVGARVYAEKPAAFIRRIRRLWKAGRDQARAARAQHPVELADATRLPHPVDGHSGW
jgi:CHAD domain-containing protein